MLVKRDGCFDSQMVMVASIRKWTHTSRRMIRRFFFGKACRAAGRDPTPRPRPGRSWQPTCVDGSCVVRGPIRSGKRQKGGISGGVCLKISAYRRIALKRVIPKSHSGKSLRTDPFRRARRIRFRRWRSRKGPQDAPIGVRLWFTFGLNRPGTRDFRGKSATWIWKGCGGPNRPVASHGWIDTVSAGSRSAAAVSLRQQRGGGPRVMASQPDRIPRLKQLGLEV